MLCNLVIDSLSSSTDKRHPVTRTTTETTTGAKETHSTARSATGSLSLFDPVVVVVVVLFSSDSSTRKKGISFSYANTNRSLPKAGSVGSVGRSNGYTVLFPEGAALSPTLYRMVNLIVNISSLVVAAALAVKVTDPFLLVNRRKRAELTAFLVFPVFKWWENWFFFWGSIYYGSKRFGGAVAHFITRDVIDWLKGTQMKDEMLVMVW